MGSAELWGFARVAILEHTRLWGGAVDCDDWESNLPDLVREISSSGEEDQVVFRHGRRFVPRLTITESDRTARKGSETTFGFESGPILITGGVGGLGLELAKWLAAKGADELLLVSRSGKPTIAGRRNGQTPGTPWVPLNYHGDDSLPLKEYGIRLRMCYLLHSKINNTMPAWRYSFENCTVMDI